MPDFDAAYNIIVSLEENLFYDAAMIWVAGSFHKGTMPGKAIWML